jgi:hypothetical protein
MCKEFKHCCKTYFYGKSEVSLFLSFSLQILLHLLKNVHLCLKGSAAMTERSNTSSGEFASASCSGSGSHFQNETQSATDMFVSHQDIFNISNSSSSSSTRSSNGWCVKQSVADVDIVEMTDWTGDVSNLDTGPDPLITITEDEPPNCTFSEGNHVTVTEVLEDLETPTDTAAVRSSVEDVSVTAVEVMETDEAAAVALETEEDHDHNITADVPFDEIADIATEEPFVTVQVCENY